MNTTLLQYDFIYTEQHYNTPTVVNYYFSEVTSHVIGESNLMTNKTVSVAQSIILCAKE